jgi:glycosyltransferase involved in cell wall biosynthesis
VIALSEYGRRDIIEQYGLDPATVTAIPLAASERFGPVRNAEELQRVRQTYGIDSDYVLSVGAIQPRKNLNRLVTAYSRLRRGNPKVKLPKLVLVGKCAWLYDETLKAIKELELSDSVIVTGYVPEADLPAYIQGRFTVYPSYLKGLVPPLEGDAAHR